MLVSALPLLNLELANVSVDVTTLTHDDLLHVFSISAFLILLISISDSSMIVISMSSNAEVRDKELEKLQEEIGEGYEVNDIQGRAKLKAEYEKLYSDEMEAARAALTAGDASAAAWHKLKAYNANDSLKVLDKLK
jgi:hypothetical protein